MTHVLKTRALALVLALGVGGPVLSAQTAPAAEYFTGSATGDVLAADIGGFGGAFAAVGLNFLFMGILGSDGDYTQEDQLIASSMTALSAVPLSLSGSPDALALSIAQAGVWGLEQAAGYGLGTYSIPANLLYWGKVDMTMYAAYDSYASFRLRSAAWDNAAFRRHGFLELMGAPFGPEFATPQTLLAVGGGIASTLLFQLVNSPAPWDASPFATGKTYLGAAETDPLSYALATAGANFLSGCYTGVGEEAVYRGFLHEELKGWIGAEGATAVDTAAFLAMHLFTDLARGMRWESIATHLAFVAVGNLLFDWAYDSGGLRLAVSAHAWWDIAAFFMNALLNGGAPSAATGH